MKTLVALYEVNTSLLINKVFVSNKMFYSSITEIDKRVSHFKSPTHDWTKQTMHNNAKHTISSWEVVSCNTRKVSIISLHHATTLPPRQGIKFIHFSIKWNEKNKRSKVKNKSHGLFVN